MKKFTKKAFTLVELLVVIAILAVLATVSIVGYSKFIDTANKSKAVSTVKALNVWLQADEEINGKPGTLYEMQKRLDEGKTGIDITVENLVTIENATIGYDVVQNRVVLLKDYKTKEIIEAPDNYQPGSNEDIFIPMSGSNYLENQIYSTYLTSAPAAVGGKVVIQPTKGIDVGDCIIDEIVYKNNSGNARNVIIRTNSLSSNITIVAAKDTIKHYGIVGNVDVKRAADASYHEYGTAGFVKCASGRVVAERGGVIDTVLLTEKGTVDGDPNDVSLINVAVVQTNGGTINHEYATKNIVVTANNSKFNSDQLTIYTDDNNKGSVIAENATTEQEIEQAIEETKEEAQSGAAKELGYEVSIFDGTTLSYSSFDSIRYNVNNGINNYAGCTITMLYDLDLDSKEWTPIGISEANAFAGSFDGNGKKIYNLSITKLCNEGTAFFGYVNNPNNTIEFKDVTFVDSKIELDPAKSGKNVGTIIGYALKSCKKLIIDNVDVTGNSSVSGKAHVGGIVGKIYSHNAIVKNCDNCAMVTCGGMYAGGIVAIASDSAQTIEFNNCINNGVVSGTNSGGIVGRTGSLKVDFINCQNKADVTGGAVVGGIVGTAEGTIELNIDKNTKVVSGTISGNGQKGILIGYTYAYNSPCNKVTINREGNDNYADTDSIGLIGEFSVAEITIINAKLHNMYVETSWKGVAKLHFDNCVVDNVTWYTKSGEHGTGSEAHANDGEYLYISSINSSVLTSLTYNQEYSFYKNYYSFKGFTTAPTINNANSSPLVSVDWYE